MTVSVVGFMDMLTTLSFARGLTLVAGCDLWMRYCDKAIIICYNYGEETLRYLERTKRRERRYPRREEDKEVKDIMKFSVRVCGKSPTNEGSYCCLI